MGVGLLNGRLLVGLLSGRGSTQIQQNYESKEMNISAAGRGGGGGFMGWVIRIIFDPNTRQWGGGGGLWGR